MIPGGYTHAESRARTNPAPTEQAAAEGEGAS